MASIFGKLTQAAASYVPTAVRALAATTSDRIGEVAQRALESTSTQALTDSAVRAIANTSATSTNSSLLGSLLFATSMAAGTLFQKSANKARGIDPSTTSNDVIGFTNDVRNFLSEIQSEQGISLASYKTFIEHIQTTYPHLTLDEMNRIAVEEFNNQLTSEQQAALIEQLTNHHLIEQEAAQKKDALNHERQTLLNRESILAGPSRFKGTIDDAWKNYFNTKKECLKNLAPLCRMMKNQEPRLSQHEKNVLRSVKAASKNGHNELEKMQKGLIKMATGQNELSIDDVIHIASNTPRFRSLADKLMASHAQMIRALDEFNALKSERSAIAGLSINPLVQQPLAGSLLGTIDSECNLVDSDLDALKEHRGNRAAFIPMISSFENISAQFTE